MVLVSSAVTSTLIVFAPTLSETWKPSSMSSASASAVPPESWISYVALLSLTSGTMVISSTAFATDAV